MAPGDPNSLLTAVVALGHRAAFCSGATSILHDDMCLQAWKHIQQSPIGQQAQPYVDKPDITYAIRSLFFDARIRASVVEHGTRTVVSIGTGLETQAFRLVDLGLSEWYSVDSHDVHTLRKLLFTRPPFVEINLELMIESTADLGTILNSVKGSQRDVYVVAAGVLMYLEAELVREVVKELMSWRRLVGLGFDTIGPRWSVKGGGGKINMGGPWPKMPWGADRHGLSHLANFAGGHLARVAQYSQVHAAAPDYPIGYTPYLVELIPKY